MLAPLAHIQYHKYAEEKKHSSGSYNGEPRCCQVGYACGTYATGKNNLNYQQKFSIQFSLVIDLNL